jgi:hypothetical protein
MVGASGEHLGPKDDVFLEECMALATEGTQVK